MAEHVWEHLWEHEIKLANANCYKYLKKGGKLRLAVPDGYFPGKEYIENARPSGTGAKIEDHKILFNYKLIQKLLKEAGIGTSSANFIIKNGILKMVIFCVHTDSIKETKMAN
jgi:predicted SAM-dependent methyltransferase